MKRLKDFCRAYFLQIAIIGCIVACGFWALAVYTDHTNFIYGFIASVALLFIADKLAEL